MIQSDGNRRQEQLTNWNSTIIDGYLGNEILSFVDSN